MIIKETIEFSEKSPPFHFFDRPALKYVTTCIAVEFCPNCPIIQHRMSSPMKRTPVILEDTGEVYAGTGNPGMSLSECVRWNSESLGARFLHRRHKL